MAKKRKSAIKKKRKRTTVETKKLVEVATEMQSLLGRYSNHIQVAMQREEFVLDFFAQTPSQMTHQSRIFITPAHAARLLVLLKRQLRLHKARFG